jgi:putative tricarboxylic transport membrane protein
LPCLIVSILAVLQLESRLLDVYTAIGFGLLGYFWRAHDWPRVPFVIAFVLGSLIETNLVLTVQLIELDRIVPQERIASVALFIMILGSVLWLRTRRMESERSVGALTSDAVIGMLASLAAAVLVLIALFGGAGYSWYAKFLITLSLVLGLVIAGWSLKALYRSDKTLFLNPLRWSVHLLPPPEQRLPLVLLVLLALLIGFTGISMAIGLVAIIWFYYRAPPTPGGRLRALASGILLGLVTYYFVNFVANLLLPQSLLERWLGI